MSATVLASRRGSSASSGLGRPWATSQKLQRRVHVAHDHEGGGAVAEAFVDVRAAGVLADGDQAVLAQLRLSACTALPLTGCARGSSRACAGPALSANCDRANADLLVRDLARPVPTKHDRGAALATTARGCCGACCSWRDYRRCRLRASSASAAPASLAAAANRTAAPAAPTAPAAPPPARTVRRVGHAPPPAGPR